MHNASGAICVTGGDIKINTRPPAPTPPLTYRSPAESGLARCPLAFLLAFVPEQHVCEWGLQQANVPVSEH